MWFMLKWLWISDWHDVGGSDAVWFDFTNWLICSPFHGIVPHSLPEGICGMIRDVNWDVDPNIQNLIISHFRHVQLSGSSRKFLGDFINGNTWISSTVAVRRVFIPKRDHSFLWAHFNFSSTCCPWSHMLRPKCCWLSVMLFYGR